MIFCPTSTLVDWMMDLDSKPIFLAMENVRNQCPAETWLCRSVLFWGFSGTCEEGGLSFVSEIFWRKVLRQLTRQKQIYIDATLSIWWGPSSQSRLMKTRGRSTLKKRFDAGAVINFSVAQIWWPDFSHLTKDTNSPGAPIHAILADQFGLPFIACYVMAYMLVTMGC